MSKKSRRRLEEFQREYQEWSEKAARKEEEQVKRRRKELGNLTACLEARVYSSLSKKVYASCGLEDVIDFYSPHNELALVGSEERQIMMQFFHEHTGLKVEKADREYYLRLDLSGEAKNHRILRDGEDYWLCFSELIAENAWRRKIWKANLSTVARRMVGLCREALETMPSRFYGFPEKILVAQYCDESHSSTPFSDKIQVGELQINYNDLTTQQKYELGAEMNKMIVGGWAEIDLEQSVYDCLWIWIHRSPVKVMVDNPYFNYGKLCAEYDEMTPELEKVFRIIIAGVRFPEATKQILDLSPPQREMVYHLRKEDGICFKSLRRIKDSAHAQHLMDAFADAIPGIKVTGVRILNYEVSSAMLCGHGWHTESLNERVELTVEIDGTGETAAHEIIARQLQVEQAIRYIKKHRVGYLAEKVIDLAVDCIDSHGHWEDFRYEYPWRNLPNGSLTIPLSGHVFNRLASSLGCETSEIKVNLMTVEDEDFIARLEKSIARKSNGIIEVDFNTERYRLCLAKKS